MFAKFLASALLGILCAVSVYGACSRDRNVVIKKPLYLNYGSGFFFMWEFGELLREASSDYKSFF